jgi:small basic protein
MIPIIGLLLGALLALVLHPSVPQSASRYLAIVVIAAIDASLGGVRSSLERTFSDRIFMIAFLSNALAGAGLVWIGDQVGVDLTTAIVVVFGIRIFQNVAAVRRRLFGG